MHLTITPKPVYERAVQVGVMLDGSNEIAEALQRRGLRSVALVDQKDVISFVNERNAKLERKFSEILPLKQQDSPAELHGTVMHAVQGDDPARVLIYAGQEASVPMAFGLQKKLQAASPNASAIFPPPDKMMQRMVFAATQTHPDLRVAQPRWHAVTGTSNTEIQRIAAHVGFPAVVKPVNGGGGLGISVVHDYQQLRDVLRAHDDTPNYGGGKLTARIVEEQIGGPEYSMQAMVHDGVVDARSICSKIVAVENDAYRELGHLAHAPDRDNALDVQATQLVQRAVNALQYKNGPLQVDLVQRNTGELLLLEMGFRQSGMAVSKISDKVSHLPRTAAARPANGTGTWADAIAANLLHQPKVAHAPTSTAVAATMALRSEAELSQARRFEKHAPTEMRVAVVQSKPLPTDARTPRAMRAYAKQFGDVRGRIFIDAHEDAIHPEPTIRQMLTTIITSSRNLGQARYLKPASLGT